MTVPSNAVLAQRLAVVEARLAELENSYGATLYRMERRMVRTELWLTRIAERLGEISAPTDAEVDAVLDEG